MMADNPQKATVSGYAEIIGFLIKAEIAFIIIRLAASIRFTGGIFAELFHTALFVLVIFAYIRESAKRQGLTLQECRITPFRCNKQDVLRAVGIITIVMSVIAIIAGGIRPTGIDPSNLAYISLLNFIQSSVGSGIGEELFFRGYLFKRVEEKSNWKAAVILTSIFFGLGHIFGGITPAHMFFSFVGSASLGALFSVMTYKHGTIWSSVLIHMCMNSKERLIGFSESSSLFVFDFVNIPIEVQSSIAWGVISLVSVIVILIDLRTLGITNKKCS